MRTICSSDAATRVSDAESVELEGQLSSRAECLWTTLVLISSSSSCTGPSCLSMLSVDVRPVRKAFGLRL
jgi:hypothetical protein